MKDIFLCHCPTDEGWATRLGERIEAETWNGRPLSVWIECWDVAAGDNVVVQINEGLKQSRFVGVVLSPEFLDTARCQPQWTGALVQGPMGDHRARVIPMIVRDRHLGTGERLEIPPVLSALSHLDFRVEGRDSERSVRRLIATLKGEALPRGRMARQDTQDAALVALGLPEAREEPDRCRETLLSNLLPIRGLPATIWSAPAAIESKKDLAPGTTYPPFILRERRLLAFEDLSQPTCSLRPLIEDAHARSRSRNESAQRHTLVEWRRDVSRWRWVIELLNDVLRQHLWSQGIGLDRTTRRFYFRARGKHSLRMRWGAGGERCVVRAPDPGKGTTWVHHAARLRLETLGDKLYISIEPSWLFTRDGIVPVSGQVAGPLAIQWGGRERNRSIAYHVLLWADAVTRGRRELTIRAGPQEVRIGRLPAVAHTVVGIADDWVTVKALQAFTRAEQNLDVPDVFGFLEFSPDPTGETPADGSVSDMGAVEDGA